MIASLDVSAAAFDAIDNDNRFCILENMKEFVKML